MTSDVMLKYQKWQHWYQYSQFRMKSRGSGSRTAPLFRHKGWRCGGNALFFRWLLSLCYIINIWSYSSHLQLHHMLLRGPSEKVLISRFVGRKSSKRDYSV